MKKTILITIIILGALLLFDKKEPAIVRIPDEAIRFRVIAASDNKEDQELKRHVKDVVGKRITTLLDGKENIKEARDTLKQNLPVIEQSVLNTLQSDNNKTPFKVNFGANYFPNKFYKGVKYDEGYYESLVITLGKGEGNNWWCVLFPPLCLLEATEEESSKSEYRFLVKDLIDKYF